MAAARAEPVERALEQLYAAPLEGFIALRKELAASLKAAGGAGAAEGARLVAAAPKPSRTAWALNQVARTRGELLRAMLDARDAAAATQNDGEADAIRAAAREYRARVTEVTHAARDLLAAAGMAASADQLRRMGETLTTASVEGAEARALLTVGRLTEDVQLEDPFAGLEAGAGHAAKREPAPAPRDGHEARDARAGAATKNPAPSRHDARAAASAVAAAAAASVAAAAAAVAEKERLRREAAREAAFEQVRALESEAHAARAEARARESAALRAQDEADRARRAVAEVERRLERARESLRGLRG